jgi:hypothetical protein
MTQDTISILLVGVLWFVSIWVAVYYGKTKANSSLCFFIANLCEKCPREYQKGAFWAIDRLEEHMNFGNERGK